LGAVAFYVEQLVLEWSGLGLSAAQVGVTGALMATCLLVAPLVQALARLAVLPLDRARQLSSPNLGLLCAALAAAGIVTVKSVALIAASDPEPVELVRAWLGAPAQLFFAGAWGHVIGSGAAGHRRWFSLTWLGATLLLGLYQHIVFGRGPALLIAALPLLVFMAALSFIALKEKKTGPDEARPSGADHPFEAPTLDTVRALLRKRDRPLVWRWVAVGTFVTLGTILTLMGLAVYLGHQLGVDFALADESDVRSTGPLILLGAALLSAFPLAGFLIARASAAESVLEPALAAGMAILFLVVLLAMAAPIAVFLALSAAPVAFALACGGAWLGLVR
jgi:hypothetical protein